MTSGTPIGLKDLILVDENEFVYYILEGFQRMYNEAPEEYREESAYIVENDSADIDNFNYYIAGGFVKIIIPYADNE